MTTSATVRGGATPSVSGRASAPHRGETIRCSALSRRMTLAIPMLAAGATVMPRPAVAAEVPTMTLGIDDPATLAGTEIVTVEASDLKPRHLHQSCLSAGIR